MNTQIENIPPRIAKLPVDKRGYPVPWFVAWVDGEPDFRVVEQGRIVEAITTQKCWICGEGLGRYLAFVIGPMCAVNRISSEPPSHRDCAEFAARACPFLTMPKMKRNEHGLPEDYQAPAGVFIKRNPGVALIWITKTYHLIKERGGGILFEIGNPVEVLWFAEGHPAARAEVMESISGGLPLLVEAAARDGDHATALLRRKLNEALKLLPAA
jgi:hypothetical protein